MTTIPNMITQLEQQLAWLKQAAASTHITPVQLVAGVQKIQLLFKQLHAQPAAQLAPHKHQLVALTAELDNTLLKLQQHKGQLREEIKTLNLALRARQGYHNK